MTSQAGRRAQQGAPDTQQAALQQRLSNLAVEMRMLEGAATELQARIGVVDAAIRDYTITDATLSELKSLKADDEILVPIGAGSFLKARIIDIDNVLIGVGAGVTIEKTAEEAKASVQSQISELQKLRSTLVDQLGKVGQRLEAVRGEIGKITSTMRA